MELALYPDLYVPNVDERGVYIDNPLVCVPSCGILCPCYNRRYATKEKFAQHVRCHRHKTWLHTLSLDQKNFYKKCVEQEQTIRQQRLLIAELEKKLHQQNVPVANLIDA